jgi:5'-nucleotidase
LSWLGCGEDEHPPPPPPPPTDSGIDGSGDADAASDGAVDSRSDASVLRAHKLLVVSDFQGRLLPPAGEELGGIAYLLTHLRAVETARPGAANIQWFAGDSFGATAYESAAFRDEPMISIASRGGFHDYSLGPLSFDRPLSEFDRLANGPCHPDDDCTGDRPAWEGLFGASFGVANLADASDPESPFVYGTGFLYTQVLALTHDDALLLRDPAFTDTVDLEEPLTWLSGYLTPLLMTSVEKGLIVSLSEVKTLPPGVTPSCTEGPLFEQVSAMHEEVDVVITNVATDPFQCDIDGRLVFGAGRYGLHFAELTVTMDTETEDIVEVDLVFRDVTRDVTPDSLAETILAEYLASSAWDGDTVMGTVAEDITDEIDASGEMPLGELVADAYREATGTELAFVDWHHIRAPLIYARSEGETDDGQVTLAELATSIPLDRELVTMDLSGGQLKTLLEYQWDPYDEVFHPLQMSGMEYSYSASEPRMNHVDPADVLIGGVALDMAATYRVTLDPYLATGAYGFYVVSSGDAVAPGPRTRTALEDYFTAHPDLTAPAAPRVTRNP